MQVLMKNGGIQFIRSSVSAEQKTAAAKTIMEKFSSKEVVTANQTLDSGPKVVNKLCWQCYQREPLGQRIYCGECLAKQSAADTTKAILFDDLQLNPFNLSAKQIWLGVGVFVIGLLLIFMSFCGPEKGTNFQTSTPKVQKEFSKK